MFGGGPRINNNFKNTNQFFNQPANNYNNINYSINNSKNNEFNIINNSNYNANNSINNLNNNMGNSFNNSNNNIFNIMNNSNNNMNYPNYNMNQFAYTHPILPNNNNSMIGNYNNNNRANSSLNNFNMINYPQYNNMGNNEETDFQKQLDSIFYSMNRQYINSINNNNNILKDWKKKVIEIYNKIKEIKYKNANKIGKKIYVNFHDLCGKEIYVDLELNLKFLIYDILSELGYNYGIKVYERAKRHETTKEIIENPKMKFNFFEESNLLFSIYFKDTNLFDLLNRTGYEIGLSEGKKINLKINNDNIINTITNKEKINVSFISNTGDKIDSFGYKTEKLGELLKRFFVSYKFDLNLFNKKIFFMYKGAKFIVKDLVQKLSKYNMEEGSNIIFLNNSNEVNDNKMINIIELESGKIKNVEINQNTPVWRKINIGLNVIGICKNKECEVVHKEVIFTFDLNEKLHIDLYKNYNNIICPICKKIIVMKKVGFWKCEFQIIGNMIVKGDVKPYCIGPKQTKNDEFVYFNLNNGINEEIDWTKFDVYVLPKQEIEYEET